MSKQRTDTGGVKGFVKRMLGRPSQAAGGATPEQAEEALRLLLKLMRKQLETGGSAEAGVQLCKVKLAELIFTEVVNKPPTDPDKLVEVIDGDKAQDWAFACAEVLGFLAGTTLAEDAIDGALDEANRVAKKSAHRASDIMHTTLGPALTGKLPTPRASKSEPTTAASKKATKTSAPMLEQKRKMVEDLESEAVTEDARGNTAAAAALRAFASMKKKEVEIEEELNKTGKSAA